MRVLVTRPQAAAATTLRRLSRDGHEVLLLPLTEAEHLPFHVPPVQPSMLVATSAEAFRALDAMPEVVEALCRIPIYCVGPATGEAAIDLGFHDVRIGPGDGAGLAARLVADVGGKPGTVLYLAGMPRTPAFEAAVAAAGVTLKIGLVYAMSPVARSPGELAAAVEAFGPDAVLFYSREAVRAFFGEIAPAMLPEGLRILCLSAAIAQAVPPGCADIEVASRPDEDALMALLDG
jgi:uroporphyrinogen-III synthase